MDIIACIRRFNRTLTQHVGVLDDHYLGRGRSVGASRVLFEISVLGGAGGVAVRTLRARLGLDSGYLSRLLRALEQEGLIVVQAAPVDSRVRQVLLTTAGHAELAVLNQLSDQAAANLLNALSEPQQIALTQAMDTIERLLRVSAIHITVVDPDAEAARYCLAQYYRELNQHFPHGFDPAHSLPATARHFTPPRGFFVIASLHEEILGCGAMKCEDGYGYIKRMWVAASSRGLGLGQRILAYLENLARAQGLPLARLETNQALTAAQALYKKCGYREVAPFNDEPYAHHWFEKVL